MTGILTPTFRVPSWGRTKGATQRKDTGWGQGRLFGTPRWLRSWPARTRTLALPRPCCAASPEAQGSPSLCRGVRQDPGGAQPPS